MPQRLKDTKISQRFKYQHYKLSEAFEPLWQKKALGVDSQFENERICKW